MNYADFAYRHPEKIQLSIEYIRGLVEGEGCFTFCTNTRRLKNGRIVKDKIPAFSISMHERDEGLLRIVRNSLGLKTSVLKYDSYKKDGYNRGRKAVLIIRDPQSIKNIIIPVFYNKLAGNKGRQFNKWLHKIGTDSEIPARYKHIYNLYKKGYYDTQR